MRFANVMSGLAVGLLIATPAAAQDVDASKPTNFYPLLDNSLEYNARTAPEMSNTTDIDVGAGGNLVGYRAQLIYPPNDKHLILVEVPLLYNDSSEKFGLSDIRGRYFFLPYKNYDNFFGAFGPSVDIFAPTGSFEDGLGSSRWRISPGITAALMFADWIQTFPIVSYQYASEPTTDLIPEDQKTATHGVSIQSVTPVVFSDAFFAQITPIWSLSDFTDEKTSRYIQEVLLQYAISPTLQASAFWRGVFADDDHTFRVGLTVFFVGG